MAIEHRLSKKYSEVASVWPAQIASSAFTWKPFLELITAYRKPFRGGCLVFNVVQDTQECGLFLRQPNAGERGTLQLFAYARRGRWEGTRF